MQQLCRREKNERIGIDSLEKKRFWGDLIVAFQHPIRAYKEDGEIYLQEPGVRRGNGFTLTGSTFRLDVRRVPFHSKVVLGRGTIIYHLMLN